MSCTGKEHITILGDAKQCLWRSEPGLPHAPEVNDCILATGFWDDQGICHDWCDWRD